MPQCIRIHSWDMDIRTMFIEASVLDGVVAVDTCGGYFHTPSFVQASVFYHTILPLPLTTPIVRRIATYVRLYTFPCRYFSGILFP